MTKQKGGKIPFNVKSWNVLSILRIMGVMYMVTTMRLHLGLLKHRRPVANVKADDKHKCKTPCLPFIGDA